MPSWYIDLFLIMESVSVSRNVPCFEVCFQILVFMPTVCMACHFPRPFTLNLSVSLYFKYFFYIPHMVGTCYLKKNLFDTLYIWVLSPFIFTVINKMVGFITSTSQLVYFLLLFFFLCSPFPESICYKIYYSANFEKVSCHVVRGPYKLRPEGELWELRAKPCHQWSRKQGRRQSYSWKELNSAKHQ